MTILKNYHYAGYVEASGSNLCRIKPEEQAALLSYFGPGPGAGWLASLLSSLWVVAGLVATAVAVPVVLDDDDETGVVSPPY